MTRKPPRGSLAASSTQSMMREGATPQGNQAERPLEESILRRIRVFGNRNLSGEEVVAYLSARVGEAFDNSQIQVIREELERADQFSYIFVSLDNDDLIVNVVENPVVERITYFGELNPDQNIIFERLNLRPGAIFSPTYVAADAKRITSMYGFRGIVVEVFPIVNKTPDGRIDLKFFISNNGEGAIVGDIYESNEIIDLYPSIILPSPHGSSITLRDYNIEELASQFAAQLDLTDAERTSFVPAVVVAYRNAHREAVAAVSHETSQQREAFLGVRKSGDPIAFLEAEWGAAIKSGATLREIRAADERLLLAVYKACRDRGIERSTILPPSRQEDLSHMSDSEKLARLRGQRNAATRRSRRLSPRP